MAGAPLTTSEKRKHVIDFTDAFMSLGTTILFKKQDNPPFHSFKELSDQTAIKYGAVKEGRTQTFFETDDNPTYRSIGNYMKSHQSELVDNIKAGVEKVRNSNSKYAFIMENTTAAYWVQQDPCDLMTLGGTVNVNSHYAFAVRKNDPDNIKTKINNALKELKDNGDIKRMEEKWWQGDDKCGNGAPFLLAQLHWVALSFLVAFFVR